MLVDRLRDHDRKRWDRRRMGDFKPGTEETTGCLRLTAASVAEASLDAAATTRRRLLDALLAEALAPTASYQGGAWLGDLDSNHD
jgi:hypothetical protein